MEENKDLMMEIGTMEFEEFEVIPMAVEVVEKTSKVNPLTVAGIVTLVGVGAYIGYKKLKNKNEESEKEGFAEKFSKTYKSAFGKAEKGMDTDGDFDYEDLEFEDEE